MLRPWFVQNPRTHADRQRDRYTPSPQTATIASGTPVFGSTIRATFLPPAADDAAMTAAICCSKYAWSGLLGGVPSCCSAAPAGTRERTRTMRLVAHRLSLSGRQLHGEFDFCPTLAAGFVVFLLRASLESTPPVRAGCGGCTACLGCAGKACNCQIAVCAAQVTDYRQSLTAL